MDTRGLPEVPAATLSRGEGGDEAHDDRGDESGDRPTRVTPPTNRPPHCAQPLPGASSDPQGPSSSASPPQRPGSSGDGPLRTPLTGPRSASQTLPSRHLPGS